MRSNKTKILFIGSIPPPFHGVTIQNQRILNSRLNEAFDIIHLNTTDKRDLKNLGKVDFGNVYLGFQHLFKLIYLVRKHKPLIVYLTIAQNTMAFFRDGLFVLIAKILSNSKIIIHFRGGNYLNFYNESSFFLKKYIDFVYYQSDYCIVLGNILKPMISKWFKDQNVFVIPNGSDIQIDISKKQINNEKINVIFLSNLIKTKGILDLLYAIKEVVSKSARVQFSIGGDWVLNEESTKREAIEFINKNSLENYVSFQGTVSGSQKADFLLSGDILVFPTFYPNEGHPNVIIEAMAAGCPVISTDHAAIPETVLHGENGFIVSKNNPTALAKRILQLVEDDALRKNMGKKSREYFEQNYTSDKNIEIMITAFKTACNK